MKFKLLVIAAGLATGWAATGCVSETDNTTGLSTASSSATSSSTTGTQPVTSPTPSSNELTGTAALDEEEWAFVDLINQYRVANGAGKLEISIALMRSTDWMANDMASKMYLSHTDSQGRSSFTRMNDFGYTNQTRGEIIADGNAGAQATFNQWKNSAGHNAIMLNPVYKVFGVSRASNPSSTYGWYWAADFGAEVDETLR